MLVSLYRQFNWQWREELDGLEQATTWTHFAHKFTLIMHLFRHTCSKQRWRLTPDVDAADATKATAATTIETFRERSKERLRHSGMKSTHTLPLTFLCLPHPSLSLSLSLSMQLTATLAIYLLNRNFRRKQKLMKNVKTMPIKVNITHTHTHTPHTNTHTQC